MHGNPSTKKTARWITAIAAFTLVGGGCAISDYRGYLNHATSDKGGAGNGYRITQFDPGGQQNGLVGEAKLFGKESAVRSGNPELSGTFASTVEYDFRGRTTPIPIGTSFPSPILITTYRNRVFAAFNGDGNVDRDGDDIRLNAGTTGGRHDPADPSGIWERRYLFVDRKPGCQFFANFEQAFRDDKQDDAATRPAVVVCFNNPAEEIDDRDISLQCTPPQEDINPATPACKAFSQDEFQNLGQVFQRIWSGAIGALSASSGFTIEATSITVNGKVVDLSNAAVVDLQANSARPINGAFDLTSAGGQEIVKALLANTEHMQRAELSARFAGGMALDAPVYANIAFDHDELRSLLND